MLKGAFAAIESDSTQSPSGELSYDGLFAITSDPQVILEAHTGSIIQANASAARLLGISRKALAGMPLPTMLEPRGTAELRGALEVARTHGAARIENLRIRGTSFDMSARLSLVRSSAASYVLIHFAPLGDELREHRQGATRAYDSIDRGMTALAITDAEFNLLYANRTFLQLIEVDSLQEARGRALFHWLHLSTEDLGRMQLQMATREIATPVCVTLSGRRSGLSQLQALAVAVPDREQSVWGFSISERPRLN
jgi:PAS domain S-box-containing protein